MIGIEDSEYTYEYDDYYKILPSINNWNNDLDRIKNGIKVNSDFIYNSNTNPNWMSEEQLQDWISNNTQKIGKI